MTKTDDNLQAGFAGESQARNKYTYWAAIARKEGYLYIAKIFEETADNEKRHAKDQFAMLGGIKDTVANLKAAVEGENYETTTMYPEFAAAAKEEGNTKAMVLFEQIAKVEAAHRDRYKKLLKMVEDGSVYKRAEPIEWKCAVCGYRHTGTEPPEKCPCCQHPKQHYEPADMCSI